MLRIIILSSEEKDDWLILWGSLQFGHGLGVPGIFLLCKQGRPMITQTYLLLSSFR